MNEEQKYPLWVISLNILLSVIVAACGVYVLVEKKFIISGKYTGHLYHFSKAESIAIAISFFLVSAFLLLFLSSNQAVKKLAEWLLGIAIVLFLASAFFTA